MLKYIVVKIKMDRKTIALIVCVIIIVCLVGYMSYNIINNIAYNKGAIDGQISIINKINQDGDIPVITTQNNETKINWILLQQLCEK